MALFDALKAHSSCDPDPDPFVALDALLTTLPTGLSSAERAFLCGAASSSVAHAFLAGYHHALRALVPALDDAPVALCATEEGGGHPSAIRTTITADGERVVVSGKKTYVTAGSRARTLLVIASEGRRDDGKNKLVAVAVDARWPGVSIDELPPLPFVPELPHARVTLEGVVVERTALLEGDGYDAYLKPFRTIEDTHVFASLCGLLARVCLRNHLAPSLLASVLLPATSLTTVGALGWGSPLAHLTLAGAIDHVRMALPPLEEAWAAHDPASHSLFSRDRPLLEVARKARELRTQAAAASLGLTRAVS